jgi:methylated-DNA-[protein]-cysteine S-methyltransferase
VRISIGHGRDSESSAWARRFAARWLDGGGEVCAVVSWPAVAASWLRPARALTRDAPDAWVVADELPTWAHVADRLRTSTAWEPARTIVRLRHRGTVITGRADTIPTSHKAGDDRSPGMNIAATTYESPIGRLHLQATDQGLVRCHVRRGSALTGPGSPTAQAWLDVAGHELDEYFAGVRADFSLPVDLSGLDALDRAILSTLTETTTAGCTTTYGAVARLVGDVDAQRVGAAMAANPVLIVVPCHRVLGANGKLTGYAAGLRNKQRLLDLEAGQPSLELA